MSESPLLKAACIECQHPVWEVPGSIPNQGPRHNKDVIKIVPVVSFFSIQHLK